MQKLVAITGVAGEGKTLELMNDYFEHYTSVTLISEYEAPTPSRLLVQPVLVSLTEKANIDISILDSFIEDVLKKDDIGVYPNKDEFINGEHTIAKAFTFAESVDISAIEDIIVNNLKNNDCLFYIDNAHLLGDNALTQLLDLINKYPNNEISNSFDIIATILKPN